MNTLHQEDLIRLRRDAVEKAMQILRQNLVLGASEIPTPTWEDIKKTAEDIEAWMLRPAQ